MPPRNTRKRFQVVFSLQNHTLPRGVLSSAVQNLTYRFSQGLYIQRLLEVFGQSESLGRLFGLHGFHFLSLLQLSLQSFTFG